MTGMQHMEESEKEGEDLFPDLGGGERVFIPLNFLPCLACFRTKQGFLLKMNQTRFLREVKSQFKILASVVSIMFLSLSKMCLQS